LVGSRFVVGKLEVGEFVVGNTSAGITGSTVAGSSPNPSAGVPEGVSTDCCGAGDPIAACGALPGMRLGTILGDCGTVCGDCGTDWEGRALGGACV
jgi:hypothetical protein